MLKKVFKSPTAENEIIRYGFTQDNTHRVYELPFQLKSDMKTTRQYIEDILHGGEKI